MTVTTQPCLVLVHTSVVGQKAQRTSAAPSGPVAAAPLTAIDSAAAENNQLPCDRTSLERDQFLNIIPMLHLSINLTENNKILYRSAALAQSDIKLFNMVEKVLYSITVSVLYYKLEPNACTKTSNVQ